MKIPPKYTITSEMLSLISKIEAQKLYFSSLNLSPNIKEKIMRVSLLKSSLFSARIEGNPLVLSDLESQDLEQEKKQEIFNIIDAVSLLDARLTTGVVSKELILELHNLVLKNISPDVGYFRKEISAIFNQAGIAVYMPPPPSKIHSLVNKLLTYINSDMEKFPIITAFLAHLLFEKIHPFLDGNGRVGRILIATVLKAKGWDFNFIVPFEEYLDTHKDEYYFHLDKGSQNTNDYLIFMLEAYLNQLNKIKEQIEQEVTKEKKIFLPPRQDEILNSIKDQTIVSFDMLRRRFLKIPERTLRYDLKKLVDQGLIEKSGQTRGRYYRLKQ